MEQWRQAIVKSRAAGTQGTVLAQTHDWRSSGVVPVHREAQVEGSGTAVDGE